MKQIFSMTNKTCQIDIDNKKYVLRIPGVGTDKLINRYEEAEVYNVIKDLDLTDKIYFIDPESGIKISNFISNGRNCDEHNINDLEKCMSVLRQLHSSNKVVSHTFDLKEKIEFYESLREHSDYSNYNFVKTDVLECLDIVKSMKIDKCLCHIDPNKDNFLLTKDKTYLLDWEYAAMQDKLLDVAMFCVYTYDDKDDCNKLLEIYLGRQATKSELFRFYTYLAASGLCWSNWCEYKHTLGQSFGNEYELRQYRYAEKYSEIALNLSKEL